MARAHRSNVLPSVFVGVRADYFIEPAVT